MLKDITLYHEKIKLPLFHVHYNIMASNSMEEMSNLVRTLYPGLKLDLPATAGGYTCVVNHSTLGTNLVIMINTSNAYDWPPLSRRIIHECTHLSWYILDELGIEIDADNHEIQAYLMEELISEVTRVTELSTKDSNIDEKNDSNDLNAL